MTVIRKGLLQFIFSGSYMKRWNDKLRPADLHEVDKQGHKMIVAWLLCNMNATRLADNEAQRNLEHNVIKGGIFDYFFRLVITDIKPPVYYRIKANPLHFAKLTDWALGELAPQVKPLGDAFWRELTAYVRGERPDEMAARILDVAHHYASYWEFQTIRPFNGFDDEMPDIANSFISHLQDNRDLAGVPELLEKPDSAIHKLANLCGQLRFQKRWSQTPRLPETSVMGHMFIVACYAYLFSLGLGACRARLVNNFFTGLLHDLPEVLTRDIISPVKKSIEGLDAIIRDYEGEAINRRILDPLRKDNLDAIVNRLRYYLGMSGASEFGNTIMRDGMSVEIPFNELHRLYNDDTYDPRDGELVKVCDYLAAYLEAYVAVRHGVASDQIHQALWRLRAAHRDRELGPLHIGAIFADFD